jgi:hypothetical protein
MEELSSETEEGRDPAILERSAARLSALAVHLRHEAYRMRHEPGPGESEAGRAS